MSLRSGACRLRSAPPPPGSTRTCHLEILHPTRAALANARRRLLTAGHPIEGASGDGVLEALHLRDPDGNGVAEQRT
jgi:catechol 2,3-dioxygenase